MRLCLFLSLSLLAGACSSQDARLEQHRQKFQSLVATADVIGKAWADRRLTDRYARTALNETFQLLEQERAALAKPSSLADPRGARMSVVSERLSRLLSATMRDVSAADAPSMRAHLAEIARAAAEAP
jgi:hypothetical protein